MDMKLDTSMRDNDVLHMTAILSRFPIEIADVVRVAIPDGLDRTEQVAYLTGYLLLHMPKHHVVENPTRFAQHAIEEADAADRPYPLSLQDALAEHVLAMHRFWYGQLEWPFAGCLSLLLTDATERDFDEIRRTGKALAAEIKAASVDGRPPYGLEDWSRCLMYED